MRRLAPWEMLAFVAVCALSCNGESPVDPLTATETLSETLLVSDANVEEPHSGMALALSVGTAIVGVPQGLLSNDARGVVKVPSGGIEAGVVVVDGGIGPFPVPVTAGDLITLDLLSNQTVLSSVTSSVPRGRRPRVVRTSPARRKTDVPLNARITIVFSEPMESSSLTPQSIRLLRLGNAVAGHVSALHPSLDATGLSVEFIPDAPLLANAEYLVVVTTQVRDDDGEAPASADTISFTTGQSSVGAPVRIVTLPDSVLTMRVGSTFQLTAIVLDASGNQLNQSPVVWESQNTNVATVTSSGELGAISDGGVLVSASVGDVIRYLFVNVVPNPVVSLTLSPAGSVSLLIGDTTDLVPTARDADGRLINNFETIWSTSQSGVAEVALTFSQVLQAPVGRVRALTVGTTTITVRSGTGSASLSVEVGYVEDCDPGSCPQMLFIRDNEIFRFDFGTGGITPLTSGGATHPAWSADGRIAFARYAPVENPQLYVMAADGSNVQQHLAGTPMHSPSWSPDGSAVAAAGGWWLCVYDCQIYILTFADGKGFREVATMGADPAWSPDGTRIAFVGLSGDDGYHALHVMNADGSGNVAITSIDGAAINKPTWSPDGAKIAFSRCQFAVCDLYVVNADGSSSTRLTSTGHAVSPAWSPDGKRIAFTSTMPGTASGIAWIPATGGTPQMLIPSAYSPAWRP